jgi:phage FluMu protein Com
MRPKVEIKCSMCGKHLGEGDKEQVGVMCWSCIRINKLNEVRIEANLFINNVMGNNNHAF